MEKLKNIKNPVFNFLDRVKKWSVQKLKTKHAEYWLGVLSFTEASFFIVPPDVLLIAMAVSSTNKWFRYALIASAFSVLGAIFGYIIGAFFFDILGEGIIAFYNLEDQMFYVGEMFNENAFWVMFVASFTPIPYKVFVLTGGFFKINILTFLISSTIGRSLRFMLVSWLTARFGQKVAKGFVIYLKQITYILVAIILIILFIKFFIPGLL